MSDRELVIGTRGSDLALVQARWVSARLGEREIATRIEIIKTQGDRVQDLPLEKLEGKGFFTKEIEDALLAGRVDLAVHSLKDLPTQSPPGLDVAAIPEREDPRDCLLVKPGAHEPGAPALPLREGARVATGSIRRQALLRNLRPDLELVGLRGNVPTRIRKLREEELDAVVLAHAGLRRLELSFDDLRLEVLDPTVFLPAPAQGALGLQVREGDEATAEKVRTLGHEEDARRVSAERLLLARLEGGCHIPLGAHAVREGDRLRLRAFLGGTDGGTDRRADRTGSDPGDLAGVVYAELTS